MKFYISVAKKKTSLLVLSTLLSTGSYLAHAQQRDGSSISITFINEDPTLDPNIQEGLMDIIYKVYPVLMKDFNADARKDLRVKIDTIYEGVAYAHNGQVTISSKWLRAKPKDLDLITHEVMHIIQDYPNNSGPGWLTEGIADYVRARYGVNNADAGWSMPELASSHHYTDSYRITARFLTWISQHYDENLIPKLDKNLREKTYSQELWKSYTGKTLDELWKLYVQDPRLS